MAVFKKRSSSRINMMDLPSELVMEIFSRLPFNSIMQLCKLFPHIVLRPEFERFYLQSHPFTFLGFNTSTQQHHIVEYLGHDHLLVSTKLNLMDFVSKHQYLNVVASCNGLLLDRVIHMLNGLISESLMLVNPFTRRCDILVHAERIDLNGLSALIKYGLGYSYTANLYKVVCLDGKTVNILTVNDTNTWRKVECDQIMELFPYLEDGVAVSGGIHWLVGGSNMILRFDVDEEVFDFVPMAYEKGSCSYVMSQLSVLDGSLCALANHMRWYEGDKVEVWVMKDYGWTRLTVLQSIPGCDYCDLPKLKVIHVVDDGKLLIKLKNELRVYDLVRRKWEDEAQRMTMDQVIPHFRPTFLS